MHCQNLIQESLLEGEKNIVEFMCTCDQVHLTCLTFVGKYASHNGDIKDITYDLTMTGVGYQPQYEVTKDTSYLTLMAKLWGICCENFGKNMVVTDLILTHNNFCEFDRISQFSFVTYVWNQLDFQEILSVINRCQSLVETLIHFLRPSCKHSVRVVNFLVFGVSWSETGRCENP